MAESEANQKYLCMEWDLMNVIGGKVEYVEGNKEPICTIENMEELRLVAKQLKVVARAYPEDKMLLVDGL